MLENRKDFYSKPKNQMSNTIAKSSKIAFDFGWQLQLSKHNPKKTALVSPKTKDVVFVYVPSACCCNLQNKWIICLLNCAPEPLSKVMNKPSQTKMSTDIMSLLFFKHAILRAKTQYF